MVTKWDAHRTVHFKNRHQNFFSATRGRMAGRSIEHPKRYWLRFGSRAGYQNFRAFFRATLKTSRQFSIEICYIERGQCCPPINLTSAKPHAKKKRILVLNCNSESISKDTLLAMLMPKKFEIPVFTTREARNKLWRASLYLQPSICGLKWTHSDVQGRKTCPYLSLIGTVNVVLPFTEHMHRTDNHHLTWCPHPTPVPPNYVQAYADTSWVAVECNYEAKGHSPTCFGMQPNHGSNNTVHKYKLVECSRHGVDQELANVQYIWGWLRSYKVRGCHEMMKNLTLRHLLQSRQTCTHHHPQNHHSQDCYYSHCH